VFENLLSQSASGRLIKDIEDGALAPSMLFSGPPASGKGTAALELGRVISCEGDLIEGAPHERAAWKCPCPSCRRHRLLIHPDILCLGWKPFSTEIAASAGALNRDSESASSRTLFIRSIRKLLARFNPVLWEDESKAGKISPLINSLEEDLDELSSIHGNETALAKLIEGMQKNALRLESEGLSENIPIAQIRRAAYWGRLAPIGRGKLLVIENADRMQDEAKNSLLKLLEEPPGRLNIVLCCARPGSLLPTIISRLRPYRFLKRDAAGECEIIRRIFKDEADSRSGSQSQSLSSYLDSFLPVSPQMMEALAAFFAASVAFKAALLLKKQGRPLPEEVVFLGKYSSPKAEAAGLGRPSGDQDAVVGLIVEKAAKFELKSLFSRFLFYLLEHVSFSQRNDHFLPSVSYNEIWMKCSKWAQSAAGTYNLRPSVVLEKLFTDLSRGMAEI
jgi:DNA polymerase-3 subunit gamma/tau